MCIRWVAALLAKPDDDNFRSEALNAASANCQVDLIEKLAACTTNSAAKCIVREWLLTHAALGSSAATA